MRPGMAAKPPSSDFEEIIRVMWGNHLNEDIFQRWKQGMAFTPNL
jgi:hypothetical protein